MLAKKLLLISAVVTVLGGITLFSGIACNKAVIRANSGQMPIVTKPGYEDLATSFCKYDKGYKVADQNTKLVFLADRYHQMQGDVLIASYSLGDVLIRVGNLVFDVGFALMAAFLLILVLRRKPSG